MTRATDTILDMHTYCRPAGTRSEKRFLRRYVAPLDCEVDRCGNLIKRIGDNGVLWSCHTDTVHRDGGWQALTMIDDQLQSVDRNCLGSDDTAGVWLMAEMIKAERPGLYVFHRCEERGGIGSGFIAGKTPELLDGIQAAIALDRHGTGDVITHQYGGRCASNAFAQSLADLLGGRYRPCSYGVFTDTANYTELVPECTNLSVGYDDEHSATESLNVKFLIELRDKLCALDTSKLVIARDPSAKVSWMDDYYDDRNWHHGHGGVAYGSDGHGEYIDRLNLAQLVRDFPDEVADYLESFGVDEKELRQAIRERT